MKRITVLFAAGLMASGLWAQTRVISGTLTAFNEFPVANVEVTARKANTSVLSDSMGQFELVCMHNDVVLVKAKAFQRAKKRVDENTKEVEFNLDFIDTPRNREIAVGYGYMDKDDLTTAIAQHDQFMNDFCNYSTIEEAVTGRFAGVEVRNGQFYVRGQNSINGPNAALTVIDGVPTQGLSWLDPCLVKNISVIKDGSSAIYGSRGANGVVLIETKKGGD